MVVFLTTRRHHRPVSRWLVHRRSKLAVDVRVLPFERLRGDLPVATYVFCDVDRLHGRLMDVAVRAHALLRSAGCRVLNDPSHSMARYELLKTLPNDFRVYRQDEDLSKLRYPVFLRDEARHNGSRTKLLHSRAELDAACRRFPGRLIVEYLETGDAEGMYRKYSYYRIGECLFPGHLDFGRSWMVKGGSAERVEDRLLAEYRDFVAKNPHEKTVAETFRAARIEYGRIDYAVRNDRLQVWEINTNPSLVGRAAPEHEELPEVGRRIAAAVDALDTPEQREPAARLNRWLPSRGPWKPGFLAS